MAGKTVRDKSSRTRVHNPPLRYLRYLPGVEPDFSVRLYKGVALPTEGNVTALGPAVA